jgi:hypothetical protein
MVEEPDFSAATAQIIADLTAQIDGAVGRGENFNCNIRSEGRRDFVGIDLAEALSEKNGNIGTADLLPGRPGSRSRRRLPRSGFA